MKAFLTVLLCFFLLSAIAIAHDRGTHVRQTCAIFNGFGGDSDFLKLAHAVSDGIDNKFPDKFRAQFGEIPGNHRLMGHSWLLHGDIPAEVFDAVEARYPGRRGEFTKLWREFAKELSDISKSNTGLARSQAHAIASLMHSIHLLGDYEPGNTIVENVMPPREIGRHIADDLDTIFLRTRPKYAARCRQRINAILKSTRYMSDDELAKCLMDVLMNLNIGDELNQTWKGMLGWSFSQSEAIAATAYRNRRLVARTVGCPEESVAEKSPRPRQRKNVVTKAALRTCDGRLVMAAKMGGKAGLLVFAIDGGIATCQFMAGNIGKGDYEEKIAEAAAKGAAVGASTALMITLGATPTGWIVMGVGAAAYEVTDLAIELCKPSYIAPEDLKAFAVELDSVLGLPDDTVLQLPTDPPLDIPSDTPLDIKPDTVLQS